VARFNTHPDTYVVRLNDLPEDQPYKPTFALILERMNDSDEKYRRIGTAKMPVEGSEEHG
jgi:hypothetical protein